MEETYYKTEMQKDKIIERLRQNGCRITKQRRMLLDVILQEDCSCCKEIEYKVSRIDDTIGTATVYRMVNLLEEIGALKRKRLYQVVCPGDEDAPGCVVELDDHSLCELSKSDWNQVVESGMRACGYLEVQNVVSIRMQQETMDFDGETKPEAAEA